MHAVRLQVDQARFRLEGRHLLNRRRECLLAQSVLNFDTVSGESFLNDRRLRQISAALESKTQTDQVCRRIPRLLGDGKREQNGMALTDGAPMGEFYAEFETFRKRRERLRMLTVSQANVCEIRESQTKVQRVL